MMVNGILWVPCVAQYLCLDDPYFSFFLPYCFTHGSSAYIWSTYWIEGMQYRSVVPLVLCK